MLSTRTRDKGECVLYLRHTRGTLGALVPKNKHHPGPDLARSENREERVLVIEAPGGSVEPDALSASDLRDRAARREVTPQDGDVSRALDGVRQRAHDVLRHRSGSVGGGGGKELRRVRDVLRERAARDGQLRAVDDARGVREEVLEQRGDPARAVQVRHVVPAGRLEVREVRRAVRHGLEVVDRELDVCRAGHGEEVQHLRWGRGGAGQRCGGRWGVGNVRTAFVEPPRTFTIAMAFRNEFRVRMSLCWSSFRAQTQL